jgi:hypothetical protein
MVWSILAQLNVKRSNLVIVAIESVVCNMRSRCVDV